LISLQNHVVANQFWQAHLSISGDDVQENTDD